MENTEVLERLTKVFRKTLFQPSLELHDELTAADVRGWDSLSHMNLVVAIEREFKISLSMRDVRAMKNVGDLIRVVEQKVSAPATTRV